MTSDEWREVVQAEMDAEDWYATPIRPARILTDSQRLVRSRNNGQVGGHSNGQSLMRNPGARTLVWNHLEAHPEDIHLSSRQLADRISGAGKTVCAEVKSEFEQTHNGQGRGGNE
jgi:hypothetical protein